MMALARKIVSGVEEDEAETVEEVLAQARDAESEAEEYLEDDDWEDFEIGPEAAPVNGNCNGNHELIRIGTTIELVPSNRHATVAVNRATGHHDDGTTETHQTLFPWADFTA